jgi:type I restriction-modification system DNA methylase subunit
MTFISAQEAADKWGISKRRVQILCANQRIPDAVRIGNMWVIPENAKKPIDGRIKTSTTTRKPINPIRTARKALRAISSTAYQAAQLDGTPPSDAKKVVMALFASELLEHILETPSANTVERIHTLFGVNKQLSLSFSAKVRRLFSSFLNEHPFCFDDALSWAYQYVNKLSKDTGLETTQFFTEKYMITALVDRCQIEKGTGKILDPACGGGNFLLYALDYLCDSSRLPSTTTMPNYVITQLRRLYGYELDPTLAVIASVNLRVKVLSIIKEHGYAVTAEEFFSNVPDIYCSVKDNIEGALDAKADSHLVKKAGTMQTDTLASILSSAEYIFTNPPFKTVKGMDGKQKAFLKENFPYAKCDMCNAFIEFALNALADNGICGMVTQNSWMYLDSFEQLRLSLLKRYSIRSIIELGSNAFYDLSGEKTNVALLIAQKTQPNTETSIATYSLKHLAQVETERLLSSGNGVDDHRVLLNQLEVLQRSGARFGMLATVRTHFLQNSYRTYGEYAVPMQGTSTGDSKSLVGYFWEHIGDADWRPVSKGGGYSRWLGLNSYSVKWGKDGEYIKDTKGSAIRNAKYFKETQLVFSDTGTAGLNVRLLLEGQIFIASGPGIRVTQGDYLSHIAFLNSRFASYFIRLLSPKLTIAAGYIAKIPVLDELLSSVTLAEYARICIDLKRDRLSKRPIYLEYEPLTDIGKPTTLDEQAQRWFLKDIEDEWRQLCVEKEIDRLILDTFDLNDADRENLNAQVGRHALDIDANKPLSVNELDGVISELLSANCMLNRTRSGKNYLGCDGVLEYLSYKNNVLTNKIYQTVSKNVQKFHKTLAKYKDAYIHSLVLSALGYSVETLPKELSRKKLLEEIALSFPSLTGEIDTIDMWIESRLTAFHKTAFFDTPIIHYSTDLDAVELLRGQI